MGGERRWRMGERREGGEGEGGEGVKEGIK